VAIDLQIGLLTADKALSHNRLGLHMRL